MSTANTPKPVTWLTDTPHTPPWSLEARVEAGAHLRRIQNGEMLSMPHSRPMPSIGPRCHELRVRDENTTWRLMYRIDETVIVAIHTFAKKTQATPKQVIDLCQRRLAQYDQLQEEN